MKTKNEFIIEEIITQSKDKISLLGRNCDDEVSIGNIYDTLIIRLLSRNFETPSEERPKLIVPIDLKLDSIKLFNKKIPFVSQGYSAVIELTGHGIDLIRSSAWSKGNSIVYLLASENKESKLI